MYLTLPTLYNFKCCMIHHFTKLFIIIILIKSLFKYTDIKQHFYYAFKYLQIKSVSLKFLKVQHSKAMSTCVK